MTRTPNAERLVSRTAKDLRDRMAAGELSSRAVLDAFRTCCDAANRTVNALVTFDWEAAERIADAADAAAKAGAPLGLLHGLPIAVKDLQDTAGMRTTHGCLVYADNIPNRDAPIVARLRAAGAVIFAKSNTPEFGAGANTRNDVFGATGNPFNPDLTCAGSSGGSAAALAFDMTPIATGSDMGGSLRMPAAYCGVCGFRPTAGLAPAPHEGAAWSNLSVDGPMARNVGDLALLLSALADSAPIDPFSRNSPGPDRAALAMPPPVALSDLRIGFSPDLGFAPMDENIVETFTRHMRIVADDIAASEWTQPDLGGARDCFETLRAVIFEAQLAGIAREHDDRLGPNVLANLAIGRDLSLKDVADATRIQSNIFHATQAFFERFDALICPAASVTPFPHAQWHPTRVGGRDMSTYTEWMGIAYGLTLTGHPVAAIPCGLDHAGMPFGVQVVGPFANDVRTLSIAGALEAAFQANPESRRPIPYVPSMARQAMSNGASRQAIAQEPSGADGDAAA